MLTIIKLGKLCANTWPRRTPSCLYCPEVVDSIVSLSLSARGFSLIPGTSPTVATGISLFQRSRVKFQGVTFLKNILHESRLGKLHFWSAACMQIADLIQALSWGYAKFTTGPEGRREILFGGPVCHVRGRSTLWRSLKRATKVKMLCSSEFRGILLLDKVGLFLQGTEGLIKMTH